MRPIKEAELIQYAKDRDAAIVDCIKTDTLEPFKEFVKNNLPKGFVLPSDEALSISIRQMCLHCTNIPDEIKGKAVNWLTERGYHLDFAE